jgi:hypothetical protein
MQDNQKFIQVVTDDGASYQILKDALQKLVDNTHKMELKVLIQETQRGLVYPSELGCLNKLNMLGSFDLKNLGYHDGRAVVLSER